MDTKNKLILKIPMMFLEFDAHSWLNSECNGDGDHSLRKRILILMINKEMNFAINEENPIAMNSICYSSHTNCLFHILREVGVCLFFLFFIFLIIRSTHLICNQISNDVVPVH